MCALDTFHYTWMVVKENIIHTFFVQFAIISYPEELYNEISKKRIILCVC